MGKKKGIPWYVDTSLTTINKEIAMRMRGAFIFVLLCLFGRALAQEGPTEKTAGDTLARAVYYMTDMLDGNNSRMEAWEIKRADKGEYMTFKAPFKSSTAHYTLTDGMWWNETRTEGNDTYLLERYATHPALLDPGERSFGHIEERNVTDDSVTGRWPIFYEVQGAGSMRRLVMQGFLSRNMRLVIIRDYWEGKGYFLPFQESVWMLEGDSIISYFIYARIQ